MTNTKIAMVMERNKHPPVKHCTVTSFGLAPVYILFLLPNVFTHEHAITVKLRKPKETRLPLMTTVVAKTNHGSKYSGNKTSEIGPANPSKHIICLHVLVLPKLPIGDFLIAVNIFVTELNIITFGLRSKHQKVMTF